MTFETNEKHRKTPILLTKFKKQKITKKSKSIYSIKFESIKCSFKQILFNKILII